MPCYVLLLRYYSFSEGWITAQYFSYKSPALADLQRLRHLMPSQLILQIIASQWGNLGQIGKRLLPRQHAGSEAALQLLEEIQVK